MPIKNDDIIRNSDSESLRSISINNDIFEKNKVNDSFKNSLIKKNSINSVNNNIKKYINNPNSNFNSFGDKNFSNTFNDENNYLISTNRPQESITSKNINSSSLKSLQYKYNINSYREYLKYLLKDNYINYAIAQIKNIGKHIKFYNSVYILKMLIQRIMKVIHQFVFYIIKGEGFVFKKNFFFNIIKTYIINKDIYLNNNDNNDISKLLRNHISYYSSIYNKDKYIPYIKEEDEKSLINTQLFNKDINFNNLIYFMCNYLNQEKKIDNFSPDLIRYYLKKRPLKNFNIFTITRYMNSLHYILIFSSYKTKNLLNKDKDKEKIKGKNKEKDKNKEYHTYNDILKSNKIKNNNNNTHIYREMHEIYLSLDDNKSCYSTKINTFYSMRKKIGQNMDFKNFGNSTHDEFYSKNVLKNKNNDSLINREIVKQIYEEFDNKKKNMRRSVNYEKSDEFELKRHVTKLSSSNVDNSPIGRMKQPNSSLVKKKFIYMKKLNIS